MRTKTATERGFEDVTVRVVVETATKILGDPEDRSRLFQLEELDFRLREGSAAVDAGCELPNLTDGFTGNAPDLGAYEYCNPLPHYGPRTSDVSAKE